MPSLPGTKNHHVWRAKFNALIAEGDLDAIGVILGQLRSKKFCFSKELPLGNKVDTKPYLLLWQSYVNDHFGVVRKNKCRNCPQDQ